MIGCFYALAWWFGAPFIVFHADPPQLNSATPLAAPVHRSKTPAMHSPGGECMAGLHPFSLGVGGAFGERLYSERRKFNRSCCCAGVSALKCPITPLASEPSLRCSRMACSKSLARPSCRKNRRCPSPHKGAVRNSSGPALPCEMPSCNRSPMWCSSRSENKFACTPLRPAALTVKEDCPVASDGVWHSAHPVDVNNLFPF